MGLIEDIQYLNETKMKTIKNKEVKNNGRRTYI